MWPGKNSELTYSASDPHIFDTEIGADIWIDFVMMDYTVGL
jgi:hypothetical protein